ncbi:MAG: glycosyltransferase family 2 protein [Lentisphaeria bacterium]|nr:glycosyltransferase family 2 protein [Lentisphaeria bacterium]
MRLSVCIPTYNRAGLLQQTLESIVTQDAWSRGETEIVVADNCSDDRTPAVVAEFTARFPDRVRAVRHIVGMDAHENFEFVMRMGQGDFLKLNNDTLAWRPGALGEFLRLLDDHPHSGVVLTPNTRMAPGYGRVALSCGCMDEMLRQGSYFLTWIGAMCFRREAFLTLNAPSRRLDSRLTQTDMALRLAERGWPVLMDGRIFFDSLPAEKTNHRSLLYVFSENFPDMLEEYVPEKITRKTREQVKRSLLRDYIIPTYFDFFGEYPREARPGYWRLTRRFHRSFYFFLYFPRIALLWLLGRTFSHDALRRWKRRFRRGEG